MTTHSTTRRAAPDPSAPAAPNGAGRVRGVVLAGGESRRMGEPKALLTLGGRTLLERALGLLAEVTDAPPLVSLPHASRCDPRLAALAARLAPRRVVRDAGPDRGPVAGIVAALEALTARDAWLLWIAVDLPRLDAGALRVLRDGLPPGAPGAVAAYRGRVQPVCALLSRATLPLARRAAAQRRGPVWLLETAGAAVVALPRRAGGSPLLDMDTPATWRTHVRNVSRPAPLARS